MAARLLAITLVVAATLTGCSKTGDTIEEIEQGENGTEVETEDGRQYFFRHGIDCDQYDRLWECATRDDLLVPRKPMRPLISPRP
jgi:hypothetical protein